MKDEVLSITHTILILLAWASPFWLDWKIIFICLALYELQILIFKGCTITAIQFERSIKKQSNMTMYAYWSEKLGFRLSEEQKNKLNFKSKYIMPLIIFLITIIWQILLNMSVLIKV